MKKYKYLNAMGVTMRGKLLVLFMFIMLVMMTSSVYGEGELIIASTGKLTLYDVYSKQNIDQLSLSSFYMYSVASDGEWVYGAGKVNSQNDICKFNINNLSDYSCGGHGAYFGTSVELRDMKIKGDFLYVAGYSNGGLFKIPKDDITQITKVNNYTYSYGVVYDNDNFYIAGLNSVIKYNELTNTNFSQVVTSGGQIKGIVAVGDYLYISGQDNKVTKISKYNLSVVAQVPLESWSFDITTDGVYIYVPDDKYDYVKVFDLDLNYLGSSQYSCAGQPFQVAVNSDYLMCGTSNGYVRMFNKTLSNGVLPYHHKISSLTYVYALGVVPASCTEEWQLDSSRCLSNGTQLVTYTDLNSCGTFESLPADNGTYTSCSYQENIITNCTQLQEMKYDLGFNANYRLGADIDCDVYPYNEGNGFEPIGTESTPFQGTFNGDGHSISGLYVNYIGNKVGGLFGVIGETGEVRDLVLQSPIIQASYNQRGEVGAVAGINKGLISGAISLGGSVESKGNEENYQYTGGVVGYNTGTIQYSKCINTQIYVGKVSGVSQFVSQTGGFVGGNYGLIRYSSSKDCKPVPRDSALNIYMGGFSGFNGGLIHDAWVDADLNGVYGYGYGGGFSAFSSGVMNNTYVYGSITGFSTMSRYVNNNTATDYVYNSLTALSGGTCNPYIGVTCVSYSYLQNMSNFPTYDFNYVWYWDETVNLPKLRSSCMEHWQQTYGTCLLNDSQLKTYVDLNSCGTAYDVPEDNGTYTSCNYCSSYILAKESSCEYHKNLGGFFKSHYFEDDNYASCCLLTNIASDCGILFSPFNETTWTQCDHSGFDQSMSCDTLTYTEHGLDNDKAYWLCTMNNTLEAKCVSYIEDTLSGVVQVNPQYNLRQGSRYFVPEAVEDRKTFSARNGIVSVYFTKENLVMDGRDYLYMVRCTSDQNQTFTYGEVISPKYSNLNEPFTRTIWLKQNMTSIVMGIILLLIVAMVIGSLIIYSRQ